MPTFAELVAQRIERLTSVPDNLINAIDRNNLTLFNELVALMGELDTVGGVIQLTDTNLEQINRIIEILQQTMFDGEYMTAVVEFFKQYNVQLDLNKDILRALGDFTDDALFRQLMIASQANAIALLDETAVTAQFAQPLRQILTGAVSSEMRFSDAVDLIKNFIVGNPDLSPPRDGNWTRHAKQIAFDAFAIADRTTAATMAIQNGYEWFRYDGSVKDTTRCFCEFRASNIYHITEYQAWGNRNNIDNPGGCEISLKDGRKGWEGINDATTAANILNLLGGWNCRHIAVAVPLADVPDADKKRITA